jgi:hypothetical protein
MQQSLDSPDTHSLLNIRRGAVFPETNHKLGNLLQMNQVLGVVLPRVDDLCALCNLKKRIPIASQRQPSKQASNHNHQDKPEEALPIATSPYHEPNPIGLVVQALCHSL